MAVLGGVAVSYERGTPVIDAPEKTETELGGLGEFSSCSCAWPQAECVFVLEGRCSYERGTPVAADERGTPVAGYERGTPVAGAVFEADFGVLAGSSSSLSLSSLELSDTNVCEP